NIPPSPLFFLSSRIHPPAPSPLSLHDALPISACPAAQDFRRLVSASANESQLRGCFVEARPRWGDQLTPIMIAPRRMTTAATPIDRKSTRLNSSHVSISYAVFCMK